MKVNKSTIIVMCILCVVFSSISIILEFTSISLKQNHHDFYANLSIGLLASSFLVLIPSIVQYINEKRKYYVTVYRILNHLLSSNLFIIKIMDEYIQDENVDKHFDDIKLYYNDLMNEYSLFTKFFFYSSKDRLIESVMSETYKFLILQAELASYTNKLKKAEINATEYKTAFDTFTKILLEQYKPSFKKYKEMVDDNIKNSTKNKKFKKHY